MTQTSQNPDIFQLPQTIFNDLAGGIARVTGSNILHETLDNGNIVVIWSVPRADLPMEGAYYPKHVFARVIDPESGTFVTDEFRLFSDYFRVDISCRSLRG